MPIPENYAVYTLQPNPLRGQGLQTSQNSGNVQVGFLQIVREMKWWFLDNGNGRWLIYNCHQDGILNIDTNGGPGENVELTTVRNRHQDWNVSLTSSSGQYKIYYGNTNYAITGGDGAGRRVYLSSNDHNSQYFVFDRIGAMSPEEVKQQLETKVAEEDA